uniref:Uncharacterized protein n=1 Tax=Anguilla anguilla TaxID=7936 RepID=A0A0E9ULR4_ANGAN
MRLDGLQGHRSGMQLFKDNETLILNYSSCTITVRNANLS